MNYKPMPKSKDTPSRLARKKARNDVFQYNRKLKKLAKRAR